MARREIIQYFDDMDETPLSHDDLTVIRFSVNGTDYILEVSPANAEKFHKAIDPFVARATPDNNFRNRRRYGGALKNRVPARVVREWAHAHGVPVAPRGKVNQHVYEQYYAAHQM